MDESISQMPFELDCPAPDARSFWEDFGFKPYVDEGRSGWRTRLPAGLVIYTVDSPESERALTSVVKTLPGPPFAFTAEGRSHFLYRIGEGGSDTLPSDLPAGVRELREGDLTSLPDGDEFRPDDYRCRSIADLPVLTIARIDPVMPRLAHPPIKTPLMAFSLLGQATAFEENMVEAVPVLGDLCLAGQSTIWYAPPNAGKTLIALRLLMNAVGDGLVTPSNAYYINADDGNEGFATKLRLLDDLGVHTLAPGFEGFAAGDLSTHLRTMAETDSALGTIVIVDTIKKFADLMHKRDAAAFGDAARQYVMKGGTFLGLAHTNKNPSANGKATYAGVADLVQDADAAYMMSVLEEVGDGQERVVQFEAFKLRGPGTSKVAYAYAAGEAPSYHERLSSVRAVDPDQFEEFERYQAERSDSHIIAAIATCIAGGIVQKMALAKAAAKRAHVPERAALRTLEAYTGDDVNTHRWSYSVKERGAKVFALLSSPPSPT